MRNSRAANMLQLWDVETGQVIHTFKGHDTMVWSVAWSPDGKRIASGGLNEIIVWDVETGQLTLALKGFEAGEFFSLAWSKDGNRIVAGSQSNTIKIWDSRLKRKR